MAGLDDPDKTRLSIALMVGSGFAALGYQIVWTEQSALWLGHESAAVLAVVTAFFGGLGVGALALGARIEKSARPARWYAGCELVIALWSLLLVFAMPPFSAWVLQSTGVAPGPFRQWSMAFCATFLVLLPATAAMGATLPAMQRIAARLEGEGQSIAALYAGNTFGAVVGVLAAAFWLVPGMGLTRTALLCAALNLSCAVTSLVVFPATAEITPAARDVDRRRGRGLNYGADSRTPEAVPGRGESSGCTGREMPSFFIFFSSRISTSTPSASRLLACSARVSG